MCGIIGYIGNKKAAPILLDCLKNLEYRGYDSAGMAIYNGNKVIIKKDVGKIDEVNKKVDFLDMNGNFGIAHSRWSTHGGVTRENAHPHCSKDKKVTLVHNGIIENYAELRKSLEKNGHTFTSDTDTEVIAHLINDRYDGKCTLELATRKALKKIEGSYALCIMSPNEPDKLVVARKDSPLIIGVGEGENFVASDVPAILKYTKKVIYLKDNEVAVITKDNVDIISLYSNEVKKEIHEIKWSAEAAEKSGFPHFMLKEIFEQPNVITESVEGKLGEDAILLSNDLNLSDKELKALKRIIVVACGTSWHAGLVGEFMLEELAKIPVEVEYASEFRYRDPIIEKDTLVIAISQSGETADTLAAIREAKRKKATILSIVNVQGSSIARESDIVLYTKAGPEIGVASTKAFTAQLIMLYLLTVFLGDKRGILPKQQVKNRIRDLRLLPAQIQSILDDADYIELHAKQFFEKSNALYLGRGINFPIALEGALKLKEVSYIHAEGYPAAEMKHGPIALIDKNMPVIAIATQDNRTYKKVLSNIQEVKARGGVVIAVETRGDEETKKIVDHNLYVPKNSYILTPILANIPLQLFAYYIAVLRGLDPDRPRSLAKSVTVE